MIEKEFLGTIILIVLIIINVMAAIKIWEEKKNVFPWIILVFLSAFFVFVQFRNKGLKNSDIYAVGKITFVGYLGSGGRKASFEFVYQGKQYKASTGVAKDLRLFEGDSFPVRVLSWYPLSSEMEFTQRLNKQKR